MTSADLLPPVYKIPDAEAKAAIYPPLPDYQVGAKGYFSQVLKDPYSAQYSGWFIYRAYLPKKEGPVFGYLVTVDVNAKNSYGGYTGKKNYILWFGPDRRIVDGSYLQPELVDIVEIKP